MACSAADVELKLFGCAIPFHAERSCEKGITLEEEEEEATTNAGIHIEESIRISNGGGGGGKAPKEGVSAAENTQPSHLLPEDGNGDGYGEEEIPTGGAAIISDDNNNNGNNRLMKKPEKHRPCPRCKSLNTKFCYFNNGNANQPRHFCRGCQRYWTAGGTLRNVPVGSGRRKSKVFSSSSSSTATASTTTTSLTHRHHHHHHHLPRPLANRIDGASARSGIADSAQYLPSQSTVLPTAVISRCLQMGCSIQDINKMSQSSSSYGAVTEDSMVTMMPMDEQSMVNGGEEGCWAMTNALNEQNGLSNGSSSGETNPPAPIDEYTYGSSEQVSTTGGGVGVGVGVAGRDFMGNSRPPFGFPVQPWPYGYGLFGFPPMLNYNQSSSLAPHLATPMLNYNRSSSLAPPLATWCAPPWMGGGGGVGGGGGGCLPWPLMMPAIPPWPHWGVPPWAVTTPMAGSYNNTPPCSSSSSSLDSGKHPGDGLLQQAATGKGGCLLNPKTLRTREPQEAAQSSIWSALGLDSNHYHDHDHDHNHNNNNNNSLVSASGIFERFPPKTNEKGGADGMWESHANLAART